ncbi:hypothetical protein [Arthrobacter cryoconiti]|uniref:hypothetical protein n=1 Tax=Arthrobacter cryoconiti TaxID=748907 RepID=UPI001E2F29CF|nr:hypothetical protein [Arthrobacter cryoconiti]
MKTSVAVSVNAYWPLALLPQCATVSMATRPGCQSISGMRDMIGIASVYWFRRDLVVDFPSGYIESLNGASSRSIVAALIASNWPLTSGL